MKFLNEIRMGGNKITGLSEPTQNDEVVNKEYADGLIYNINYNLDGGRPDTNYGGIDPITGGGVNGS